MTDMISAEGEDVSQVQMFLTVTSSRKCISRQDTTHNAFSLTYTHSHTLSNILEDTPINISPSWTKVWQQNPSLHFTKVRLIFSTLPHSLFLSFLLFNGFNFVVCHPQNSFMTGYGLQSGSPWPQSEWSLVPWTTLPQPGLPFLPQHSQSSPISFTSLIPAGQAPPPYLSKASLSTSNQLLCVDGAGGGG